MNKGIVRLGDYCGEAIPHFCISGSNNVFVNGKSMCRQGDSFSEGKLMIKGSKTVFANGYGVGRVGDIVSCGFKVIKGSESVFLKKQMKGMNAITGKALEGIEHLKQSIIDILTTPIKSRIMGRDYGSRLFELVGKPINRDLTLEIYAATAEALGKFERRFKLEKVKMTELKEGKVTLDLEGLQEPSGKNIRFDGMVI